MLSTGASNALLKTLEEPPDHVVFVLATTDPQKVLPTIRSRTPALRVLAAVGRRARALRALGRRRRRPRPSTTRPSSTSCAPGGGSARDTLSALDQVVAAGGVVDRTEPVDELVDGHRRAPTPRRPSWRWPTPCGRGSDPRVLGEALLARLRDVFLAAVGADLSPPDRRRPRAGRGDRPSASAPPTLTRALEALGAALVDMRQAADPRIPLEVALVRITDRATDTSLAGLAERVAQLERGGTVAAAPAATVAPPAAGGAGGGRDTVAGPGGAAAARAELARTRRLDTGRGAPAPPARKASTGPPPRSKKAAAPKAPKPPEPRRAPPPRRRPPPRPSPAATDARPAARTPGRGRRRRAARPPRS